MADPDRFLTVADFEAAAAARMDAAAWDYYAGGAGNEHTIADNRHAWDRIRLRPRVLVDVSERNLSITVLGTRLAHPIVVAPTAAHGLAHEDAERATARGAAAADALYVLSTISTVPMETVAETPLGAPRWFQLYAPEDRTTCRDLVDRAVAAGYGGIVVTVDLPMPGNRERDRRNRFTVPLGVHLPADQPTGETGLVVLPTWTWSDLEWLRSVCPIPLIAKGILRSDDAERAFQAGCDGIWVSNHGGRQLDTSVTATAGLPEIADAVGGRTVIVADGGVRRGVDALKALALGADLVAVGRPVLWGLAVSGAVGVARVLEILRDELSLAMALAGCRTLDEITPDLLAST
ncbi:MAG: alpha-hydroxy-acid oxidizing protein [Chloroflexi bacterium]|nr:alpha-hydroxy-acid oxidizing protein [Chloroflexota bacterium]